MSELATEGQVVMPFYIICDVSASMTGDMPAMNTVVADLCTEIGQHPVADDLTMLRALAYPDFGEKRGRHFLAKQGVSIPEMLKAMIGMIATSVLSSSMSATTGTAAYVPPRPDATSVLDGSCV